MRFAKNSSQCYHFFIMPCSFPCTTQVGSSEFFFDTLCPVYDEVLRLATNGKAPRLNCSACPSGSYPCLKQKKNPACDAFFKSTPCGQNQTIANNGTLCRRCIYKYEKNSTEECGRYGLVYECPQHSQIPQPSRPWQCDWSQIFP